jgi:hypothetical protein
MHPALDLLKSFFFFPSVFSLREARWGCAEQALRHALLFYRTFSLVKPFGTGDIVGHHILRSELRLAIFAIWKNI